MTNAIQLDRPKRRTKAERRPAIIGAALALFDEYKSTDQSNVETASFGEFMIHSAEFSEGVYGLSIYFGRPKVFSAHLNDDWEFLVLSHMGSDWETPLLEAASALHDDNVVKGPWTEAGAAE